MRTRRRFLARGKGFGDLTDTGYAERKLGGKAEAMPHSAAGPQANHRRQDRRRYRFVVDWKKEVQADGKDVQMDFFGCAHQSRLKGGCSQDWPPHTRLGSELWRLQSSELISLCRLCG